MAFQKGVKPTIYGVPQSPFVRKLRTFMHAKDLPFNLISIMPGDSRKTFRRVSPFGRVPGYREGSLRLHDSSVICAYLEKTHPEIPMFPDDPVEYAKALWFEEFGDGDLAPTLTFKLMYQCFLKPSFIGIPADKDRVEEILTTMVPPLFDYLEGEIPDQEFLVGGSLSIADVTVTAHLLSYIYSGYKIDSSRWPRLAGYFDRMLETPPFKKSLKEETSIEAIPF